MELMLNLSFRRSDLVKLGWRNLVGDRIDFVPQKGAGEYAQFLSLPVTYELNDALRAITHDNTTSLSRNRKAVHVERVWQQGASMLR